MWSLDPGEYEDLEARQCRWSVKDGSRPTARSPRALEFACSSTWEWRFLFPEVVLLCPQSGRLTNRT